MGAARWRWIAAVPSVLGFAVAVRCMWRVIFGRASVAAIEWACAVLAAVVLFVVIYEQPTLRRKFGADYEEYCRNVRAWIPRMRPWVR